MVTSSEQASDLFFRFSRRSMVALLLLVGILGGTALAMTLSPPGAIVSGANAVWWTLPVATAALIAAAIALARRRWDDDSREVQLVVNDEWRRTNLNRAFRGTLVIVLTAEWPLALAFGFLTSIEGPRLTMGMATATITLGLASLIGLFLLFDRE